MKRSFFLLSVSLAIVVPAAGCASSSDDDATAEASLTAGLHEPQGAERKAIFAAFRKELDVGFNGQAYFFNATNPVGRYLVHGDFAYFEGVLEGPDGNRTPIDYANTAFATDFKNGFLAGTVIQGNFAVKFSGVAKKKADGSWEVATGAFGNFSEPAYNVGAQFDAWRSWASIPPPGQRDIFVSFPIDDLHEPAGTERSAILATMRTQLTKDMNGQTVAFNATEPQGTFLSHDNWAFFGGILEGPDGNKQALNYQNSVYATQSTTSAFKGVLRNGNFAASLRVLLHKEADGSWRIAASTDNPGYNVGTQGWVGDPASDWAWDIFGQSGNGNGDGDGDGDGG
jgi:hypothetical protein